jgi:LPS sulfotransferase NodH
MTLMVLQQTTLENTSKIGIAIVVRIHRNDALSQSASFWRLTQNECNLYCDNIITASKT